MGQHKNNGANADIQMSIQLIKLQSVYSEGPPEHLLMLHLFMNTTYGQFCSGCVVAEGPATMTLECLLLLLLLSSGPLNGEYSLRSRVGVVKGREVWGWGGLATNY